MQHFNWRGNVTIFQAAKILHRDQVINFLYFQFMNF